MKEADNFEQNSRKVKDIGQMPERETELDLLRIISLFYVICIHVNARLAGQFQLFGFGWIGTKLWYMTWCVPAFIMISGRFFLDPDRNITIQKIYQKYLKRIVIAFLFWTFVYEVFDSLTGRIELNIFGHITNALTGNSSSHFWFLYTIAGLYIITPFLRTIATSKKLCEYFFVLFLAFQTVHCFLIPIPVVGELINIILGKASFYFVLGYTAYFLFGYYAKTYYFSKNKESLIYILGIASFIVSFIGNIYILLNGGSDPELFTRYDAPTATLYSVALYTFFVKRVSSVKFSEKTVESIGIIARFGFGMYLVHYLVVWLLPIQLLQFAPMISIPLTALIVLLISFAVSCMVIHIPIIGRYLA